MLKAIAEPMPRLRPLKSESDELMHLDLLRFIASYAIVFYHFARFAQGDMASVMAHFHNLSLAVDLFVVISGFVISYVYEFRLNTRSDYSTFLWRRVARLAPLHWATLLFFVVLGLLAAAGKLHTDHPEDYDWGCLVPNALALHAFGVCKGLSFNFVSWSISAEMGMYIIAPILLLLGRKSGWGTLALSLTAMAALFWVSSGSVYPWYNWTTHFGVARAFPDFTLGVALFSFRKQLARIPAPRVFLFASLIGFVAGSFLEWPSPILLAFIYLAAVAGVACDMKGGARDWVSALGVGGQLTYSIYMLHPILLTVLLSVVGHHILHFQGALMNCWIIVVAVLVFPAGYLSFELFETPTRRWMSGSKRRAVTSE